MPAESQVACGPCKQRIEALDGKGQLRWGVVVLNACERSQTGVTLIVAVSSVCADTVQRGMVLPTCLAR